MDSTLNSSVVDPRLSAFAVCMVCNAEYATDETECSKCRLPLSVVRRCIGCSRIVSAKHTKCIYCGQQFVIEPKADRPAMDASMRAAALYQRQLQQKRRRQVKALFVSVTTFIVVFATALTLTQRSKRSAYRPVMGTAYMLREADVHNSPATSSATVGKLAPKQVVTIVGFTTNDIGQRWLAIERDRGRSYVLAQDTAPPKVKNEEGGFSALKFYIAGIDDPKIMQEARKAVLYYESSFPNAKQHSEELHWILADRARHLAAAGPMRDELLAMAREQFQLLIDSNGAFAENARREIGAPIRPSSADRKPSRTEKGRDVTVLRGTSGAQNVTGFTARPAKEVALLEEASIHVRLTQRPDSADDQKLTCSVSQNVRMDSLIVIPAGSRCEIVARQNSNAKTVLLLTSISIRDRRYSVHTREIENTGRIPTELTFQLQAPVAITR